MRKLELARAPSGGKPRGGTLPDASTTGPSCAGRRRCSTRSRARAHARRSSSSPRRPSASRVSSRARWPRGTRCSCTATTTSGTPSTTATRSNATRRGAHAPGRARRAAVALAHAVGTRRDVDAGDRGRPRPADRRLGRGHARLAGRQRRDDARCRRRRPPRRLHRPRPRRARPGALRDGCAETVALVGDLARLAGERGLACVPVGENGAVAR